jgi:hypothetical protein
VAIRQMGSRSHRGVDDNMDAFKIKNYEARHGAGTFIRFRNLTTQDAEDVLRLLKQRMGLPEQIEAEAVVKAVRDRSINVEGFDPTDDTFDLKVVLKKLRFDLADKVLLNWYRFDRIDELRADDLCSSFTDIWYPSLDDVDILDPELEWLLLIEHDARIGALKLV